MRTVYCMLPSETDDSQFNSREKHMLTDSVQQYNKRIIDLACSICTVKYQTYVFTRPPREGGQGGGIPGARSAQRGPKTRRAGDLFSRQDCYSVGRTDIRVKSTSFPGLQREDEARHEEALVWAGHVTTKYGSI